MRIVEKLLYGIGGLLTLILFFILLCHFNPELSAILGNSIANAKEQEQTIPAKKTDSETNIVVSVSEVKDNTSKTEAIPTNDGVAAIPSSQDSYKAPAESELKVPDKVAGLNGMEPIKATGIEISDHKAEELASTLSVGNTGEGLTFDETIYPYYQMLNDTGKALYRQIYANAQDLNKSFAPVTTISAGQLKNAFSAVCNDHPELFWLNTAYRYQYAPSGKIAEIDLSFNITANQIDTAKAEFEAAAKNIIGKTYGVYTDYEKEVRVHDALLSQIVYDKNAPMNQSAYSALVNSRTVCAGYARAFQYVMQQLNIPCYYVTGYAGENHAWNIIKLDDGYYNVDTTWDDTNPNTYDYFNCSDMDYAKDHARRDLSVYLPPCNGQKYRKLEESKSNEKNDKKDDSTAKVVGYVITKEPQNTSATTNTSNPTNTTGQTNSAAQQKTEITVNVTTNAYGDSDAILSLKEYYNDCFDQMINASGNNINFTNVVVDEVLWKEIIKDYENGGSEEGYISRVLVEKHMDKCTMNVVGEKQTDGTYLIRHTATLK